MTRSIVAKFRPRDPEWTFIKGLVVENGNLDKLMAMVAEGKLKAVLDPSSPYTFDEESVKKAFHLNKSRKAHGKIVIEVSEC